MRINEVIGRFRTRLGRAWKALQGLPEPGSNQVQREPAKFVRSDTIEEQIVADTLREIEEQCAELDDANRGNNGHDRTEGGDNDATA